MDIKEHLAQLEIYGRTEKLREVWDFAFQVSYEADTGKYCARLRRDMGAEALEADSPGELADLMRSAYSQATRVVRP